MNPIFFAIPLPSAPPGQLLVTAINWYALVHSSCGLLACYSVCKLQTPCVSMAMCAGGSHDTGEHGVVPVTFPDLMTAFCTLGE